jgi:thioesterase domain-containing protein/acyl carrier protein
LDPGRLPDAIRRAFPSARVVSLGGATEAAIWSNWFPVETVDPRWNSIPYGKPIQNARYHVLDRRLQPTPVGVAGELFIGGSCLAEGYLNRPELTAERFIADPFSKGSRLYRTGDLARYLEDGNIEFLGRTDFQVKIRGFRVELGEIEAVLGRLSGVREVACTAVRDAAGSLTLQAYVVASAGAALDAHAMKEQLRQKLPGFMVPERMIFLERMPLSSNGKLDRAALRPPESAGPKGREEAPRSELESRLLGIWKEVLGCSSIGIHDNFFDLGGHSLLAVMLVSRIRDELRCDVPLVEVLKNPTIAAFAAALQNGPPRPARYLISLNPSGTRTPLVLVPGSGGYGFFFQRLSNLLGPEWPVHTLQAADGDEQETIEEIAAAREAEILEAYPKGPLVLGGYSFGILVAFELAHRLRHRGREVPLLVSYDGFAPGFPRILPLPDRLLAHLRFYLAANARTRRAYLGDRLHNLRRRFFTWTGRAATALPEVPFAGEEMTRQLRSLEARLWRARTLYRPSHVERCPMLLLKSAEPERWVGSDSSDPLYGWRSFIDGPIEVATVSGTHHRFFDEDNTARIVEALSPFLSKLP